MGEPVEIFCKANSSLKIRGNFILKDSEGNVFDLSGRDRISLCRCGQSKTKPFCDDTHKAIGFQSVVGARKLPPPIPTPAP
jgi:CDGSH-type Zn-finger protein